VYVCVCVCVPRKEGPDVHTRFVNVLTSFLHVSHYHILKRNTTKIKIQQLSDAVNNS